MKQALTIAGSDSSAGAGIQADLKTFHANGVYGLSVATAITAQNTREITESFDLPANVVEAQMHAVFDDFEIAAAKTGMLSSAEIVETVARILKHYKPAYIVVDPVMKSKSGYPLLKGTGLEAVRHHLLGIATLVTPNISEAELLAKIEIRSLADAKRAAQVIASYGPQNVIVKGGHLEGIAAIDVLYDGSGFALFEEERIQTKNTHGIGCTFSAAITAQLALGKQLPEAIRCAKHYTTEAIRHGLEIGHGYGPPNHFYFLP